MLAYPFPFLRLIARLLLVVLLGTMATPVFSANPRSETPAHTHDSAVGEAAVHAHAGDHDAMPTHPCHEDSAEATGPSAHTEHEDAAAGLGGDGAHHCCPGHVLGHLLAGAASALLPAVVPAHDPLLDRNPRRFSSRIPEGLERPPRAAA